MEIRISREELLEGLQRIQSVVERKTTTPILANFLLEARGGELTYVATDLELTFKGIMAAEVGREGVITLPARETFDIVRELPVGATLELRVTEQQRVEITAGRAFFRVAGLPGEDFPPFPPFEGADSFPLPAATLREMIAKTAFCTSQDETRYALRGALFALQEGEIRMVATDGHRLATIRRVCEGIGSAAKQVIVPRKALEEMRKNLEASAGEGEEVMLALLDQHLLFRKGNIWLTTRLIDGQFPAYERVIPKGLPKQVHLPKEGFLRTLRRVAVLAAEKSRPVRLQLAPGVLTVLSESPELGEARDEVETDYADAAVTVGFNARYLMDALGVLDADEVVLEIKDAASPGLLRPVSDADNLYVIMPMRV
ncbi:MAG: DNA polymerase III subunit beta [Nitrospinae bacterium]|nr:DNA polymerase III subunit beta [Nitrospinota bacterium]